MAERTSAGLVDQFVSVTGASKKVARSMLEACNGNLEMAIEMHLDSCDDSAPGTTGSNSSHCSSRPGNPVAGSSKNSNRDDDDDIRAPIPQTRGVLVEPYQAYPTRKRQAKSVFDAFRDFQAEARQQEGGFHQTAHRGKKKTLHDLFRPPIDLLHKGTFDTAKLDGQERSKWLLVNVQDVQEFACQRLNRDVWSNDAVRTLIRESFVLWQVYRDSNEGERFIQFYHVTSYPYLAVLDPRTGEKLVDWGFMDASAFCECATEFLLEHPSLEGETPPAKKRRSESIVDASEDSQLQAAIVASMQCTTSTSREDESSADDYDLEFTDSESEEECKTPQKISNKATDVVRKEVKREINFGIDEKVEITKRAEDVKVDSSPDRSVCGSRTRRAKNKPASPGANAIEQSQKTKEAKKANGSPDRSKSKDRNKNTATTCREERTQEQAGPMCNIMVRFPNGSRTHMSLSAEASLKELVLLVQKEGYPNERFELLTNFPRRRLSCLDFGTSLKAAGLFPQETVFVQER